MSKPARCFQCGRPMPPDHERPVPSGFCGACADSSHNSGDAIFALKLQPFAPTVSPTPGDSNSTLSAITFDQGRAVPAGPGHSKSDSGRFTALRKARVLVVEDAPVARRMLTGLLRDEGHQVKSAADGAEGLAAAMETRPDLVITDLWMPVADGYDLIRALRAIDTCRTVPIIVVTGDADPAARERALRLGADRAIEKPVDVTALFAAVRELLPMGRMRAVAGAAGPSNGMRIVEPPSRGSGLKRYRAEAPRSSNPGSRCE